MHIHQEKLKQIVIVVRWLFKAHSGARKAARLWQEYFRKEVFMMAGWSAEVMESSAYHEAEDWNDNDNASTEVHSDRVRVELRIDVFQNVTSMKEHQVDIEVSTIIGTETKIVKQVSSWRPSRGSD